jgi:regulation of enolase protein 1 (concanavalin A-like superfamily)
VTQGTAPPPTSPLPSGWSSRDLGAVGAAGSASASSGVYTVRGAGADIWGTADAFHFTYREMSGDGRIVARVTGLNDTHRWAKAGVMIRESLTAGSRHAMMVTSPSMGMAFQRRLSTSGESVHTAGSGSAAPRWVALERSGNVIFAYESTNGVNWTLVGSQTIAMNQNVYVGLAVTSHVQGTLTTATFDDVIVE